MRKDGSKHLPRKRGQATFSVVLSMSGDFLFLEEKVACPLFLVRLRRFPLPGDGLLVKKP
ncbi:MAG TPA: hypothetical protein ENI18_04755 [Candidatus Aminicenantes bacterium]|nr:hypothetical protein [Candidatus Aminicenantes bacterium]